MMMYISKYDEIPYGEYEDGEIEVGPWTFTIQNGREVRFEGPFKGRVLRDLQGDRRHMHNYGRDKAEINPNELRRGIRHFLSVWPRRWEKVQRRFDRQMPVLRERVQCIPWGDRHPHEVTAEEGDNGRLRGGGNMWILWVSQVTSDQPTRLEGPRPEIYGWAELPEEFYYASGPARVQMVHKGDETFWWGQRQSGREFPIYDNYGTLRQVVREMQNENRDDYWSR